MLILVPLSKAYRYVALLIIACTILVAPTLAHAVDPGNFGSEVCLTCHATQLSFDIPPVDRDTACVACHAPGLVGTHPLHQAGSNCAAYCHPGWGDSLLTAVPRYTDPASNASFAGATSKNVPASVLHILHSNPRWPQDVDRPDSRCASCHATASCDACHTGAISVIHENHSSTNQVPYSGRFGHGIVGTDQSIFSVQTEEIMCATAGCHDIETTRSNAAHTRENFSHAAIPAYGYDEPNTVTLTPSASDWRTRYSVSHTAGRMSLSNYAGAELSITFEGERILLVADTDPYRGIGEVWIDGVLAGVVDFYAPTTTYQATVFDSGPLAPGSHTIAIRATGTKNTSSRHTFISVDCFKVYATLPGSIAPGCEDACHPAPHDVPAIHTASPADDYVLVYAQGEHDSAMDGDGEVLVSCGTCHALELGVVHNSECLTCHVAPANTIGTWAGGCQEGGCHTTYHADASAAHQPVPPAEEDCGQCHGAGFVVTAAACPNCHAVFNPSDSTPPVTSSDAQASYAGAARIRFSVTDGGKVGIATTYHRVDGGDPITGTEAVIAEPGSHALEFWSVDQLGNVESPPKTVSFTVTADTTPPMTTSNAQASYFGVPANITLTATDASTYGVKATYYSLDGGPTKTGVPDLLGRTFLNVPAVSGTVAHTLVFWSEDWSGNIEAMKTANFTITGGTATMRFYSGSLPNADNWVEWLVWRGPRSGAPDYTVYQEGPYDGSDDLILPLSMTGYWVTASWGYPGEPYDEADYGYYYLTTPGQVFDIY